MAAYAEPEHNDRTLKNQVQCYQPADWISPTEKGLQKSHINFVTFVTH